MKWLLAIGAAVAALCSALPATAHEISYRTHAVTVLSQNLYIGADLTRLLAGAPPAEVLATVQATRFSERAEQIAEAIDDTNPDLIGLQEVSLITVFDSNGTTILQLDYLQILLDALAATGEDYRVAAYVDNADVALPVDLAAGVFGRVLDRDVILYRAGTTTVDDPTSANFDVNFQAAVGGVPIEFTRGWAAVDATVNGRTYRFVNTHLEVEGAPCGGPSGLVVCQEAQAAELVSAIGDEALPTILAGDFNAEPGTTAYASVAAAGYVDTWTVRYRINDEPGFTCCQSELLTNPTSELSTRIDHVFVSAGDFPRTRYLATVLGDWRARKTPSGLWYSDHGGVLTRIIARR